MRIYSTYMNDTQIRNSADRKLCDTSRIQCVLSARLHSNQIPLSWKIGEPATNRESLARVMNRDTNEAWERAVITELGDEDLSCSTAELRRAETSSPSSAMMHPPQCGMVTCNCSALVAHTRCGAASGLLGVTEPVMCDSLAHASGPST